MASNTALNPDGAGRSLEWIPLLALLILVAALDPLHGLAAGLAAHDATSFGADRPDAVPFVSAAGCLAAGWCADRFGLRRTVAIGLIAWGISADFGAVAAGPLAFVGLHWTMTAAIAVVPVGSAAAIGVAVPAGWRALALAALFLSGRVWTSFGGAFELAVYRWEGLDEASTYRSLFLIAGTAGVVAATGWLLAVRGGDRRSLPPIGVETNGRPARGSLGLLLTVVACHTVVFRVLTYRVQAFAEPLRLGGAIDPPSLTLWLSLAFAGGAIGGAAWSDAILRRTGSHRDARGRLMVGGSLLAGVFTLAPATADPQSLAVMLVGGALGVGAFGIGLAALLDAAPRGAMGRIVGASFALGTLASFAGDHLVVALAPGRPACFVLWGGLVALAGAGASHRAFGRPRA